jgi:hypothetical protein
VNVDEPTGFSHALELSPDGHELVAALCLSTTRFGTAMLIIDSIRPIIFDPTRGIRGPSLAICPSRISILLESGVPAQMSESEARTRD